MQKFDLFWSYFCSLFFVLLSDLENLKNPVHRYELVSLDNHYLVF